MLNKSLKICAYVLYNFVFLISSLVPKKKSLWLFSAWQGKSFTDNSKYLYLYVLENCPDVKPLWITKSKATVSEMEQQFLPVAYAYRIKGAWAQIRGSIVFFSHSVEWDLVCPLIGWAVKRVQLWHGIPMKKIGFDIDIVNNERLKYKIKGIVFPFLNTKLDFVVASSDYDRFIFASAFSTNINKVFVTGYPRSDAIVENTVKNDVQFYDKSKMNVVYLPTFRGLPGSEFTIFRDTGFDFDDFALFLQKNNMVFYVKLHPVQTISEFEMERLNAYDCYSFVTSEADVYDLIELADVAIVDYSSIYFDLLLANKSFIMAPLDIEDYQKNDRDLYMGYEEYCPREPCCSWAEVQDQLLSSKANSFRVTSSYDSLRSKFFKYDDAKSSERIYKCLLEEFGC
jgi:CDP-glycerol glycerophosphotransferase